MKPEKLLGSTLTVLLSLALLPIPTTWAATGLSLSGIFLGEPDVFIPGLGLSAALSLSPSLGLFAEAQLFLSDSWDVDVRVGLNVPLVSRFLQPAYAAGFTLAF